MASDVRLGCGYSVDLRLEVEGRGEGGVAVRGEVQEVVDFAAAAALHGDIVAAVASDHYRSHCCQVQQGLRHVCPSCSSCSYVLAW